jgi:hypothetical protein
MNDPERQGTKAAGEMRSRLSDALVIGFVTVVAYLAAFRYEQGYLSYFGLSDEPVRVSVELTLRSAIGILAALLSLFALINGMTQLLHRWFTHGHRIVRLLAVFAFAIVIIALLGQYAYGFTLAVVVLVLGTVAFMALLVVLFFFSGPKGANWLDRIEGGLDREAPDAHVLLINWLGRDVHVALGVIIVAYFSAFLLGMGNARKLTAFDVSERTGQVLVRMYGDVAILKDIDLTAKRILNATQFITTEELDRFSFKRMRLRGITVEPARTETAGDTTQTTLPLTD